VGGVGVWAVWGCGVTPYVRHSTDCTCCDFGHLRFLLLLLALLLLYTSTNNGTSGGHVVSLFTFYTIQFIVVVALLDKPNMLVTFSCS
jgi:hypothetical protein